MALGICLLASAFFLQFVLQAEDNTAAVVLVISGSILIARAMDEREQSKERKAKLKELREAARLKQYLEETESTNTMRRAA